MNFLPVDYKIPKANSSYMKLEQGENKFRILSRPITGWQDWTADKRPLRFAMDARPACPIDAEKPIKHFWAFIVWNYAQKQIQILEIVQASVQKAIDEYCKTEEWGAPFFYDIKVTRSGEGQMNTKYTTTALPHKKLPDEIIEAFHKKPINLDALYLGEDPFSNLQDHYTPGVFNESKEIELKIAPSTPAQLTVQRSTINLQQIEQLTFVMSQCDDEYKRKTWDFWKRTYGISAISEIPSGVYENIYAGALNRLEEMKGKKSADDLFEEIFP